MKPYTSYRNSKFYAEVETCANCNELAFPDISFKTVITQE